MRRVTRALVKLASSVIRWPTKARAEAFWRGFEGISAFPKVLDATHIHIAAPRVNPESYINRKGYHSIQLQVGVQYALLTFVALIHIYVIAINQQIYILQAVCDHKARFFISLWVM